MSTLSPSNFHPTLSIPLPHTVLSTPAQCEAYVLLSLPPALFVDPWQAPVSGSAKAETPGHIADTHFLSGSAAEIELEKAVGWTSSAETVGRKGIASDGGSAGDTSTPHVSPSRQYETVTRKKWVAGEGIVEETIKVVAEGEEEDEEPHQLNTYAPPTKANRRERESVLFKLATRRQDSTLKKVVKSVVGSSEDEEKSEDSQPLQIPLHARYLPPVDGAGEEQTSIRSLIQQVHSAWHSPSSGNYHDVSIEGLEVFWACSGDNLIGSEVSSSDDEWEKVIRECSCKRRMSSCNILTFVAFSSPTHTHQDHQLFFHNHTNITQTHYTIFSHTR